MVITSKTIKDFRKENNITQQALAELIGVTWRTIQNYESGGKIPKSKNVLFSNVFEEFSKKIESSTNEESLELTKEESKMIKNIVLYKTKALLEHETFKMWYSLQKDKLELDILTELEKKGKLKK
ncbi:helix-turn-helix domain-containing protein [Tenacibaculum amylolyticum]|uniref:helix-turn-helix domain-containing protein n=1 Tax=Tenacibaculum amylolyticum TaxID=104269 RepID=UPI0038B41D04